MLPNLSFPALYVQALRLCNMAIIQPHNLGRDFHTFNAINSRRIPKAIFAHNVANTL
jgi:hypothetical protein